MLVSSAASKNSVKYVNAKVVLMGDSGVGKTGLSLALMGQVFRATESTHGRKVLTLETTKLTVGGREETREILLWDLAGQPGYRILHHLHLNEVAIGLVLFDGSSEIDPFGGAAYWARALEQATHGFPSKKFLVAARTDRGGPTASDQRIKLFKKRYRFANYYQTSAKRKSGVAQLLNAIREAIPWNQLPFVSAPEIFHEMKTFVVHEKNSGHLLYSVPALLQGYKKQSRKSGSADVLQVCLGRLEAAGFVKRLSFGELVILQPEILDDYCAWIAQTARGEPDGLGFVSEKRALEGDISMDLDRTLANNSTDERILLLATVQEVVGRGIAFREETEKGSMLVFPSELRADMPDHPGGYTRMITFSFEGPVRAIYATLCVRLLNSMAFKKKALYRNSALFTGITGEECGFVIDYPVAGDDSKGRLQVFFAPQAEKDQRLLFLRYVNQHLKRLALKGTITKTRLYHCTCGYEIPSSAVELRRKANETTAICPVCGKHSPIDDLAEASGSQDERVAEIDVRATDETQRQTRRVVMAEKVKRREYDVFLCHNGKDKPVVQALADKLTDSGVLPFLDERGIPAGGHFIAELERVISDVPVVLILIGKHSLGDWQKQEYYAFLQRFVDDRRSRPRSRVGIIPVLLPGAPDISQFPLFLRSFTCIDLANNGLDDPREFGKLVGAILG